MMKNPISINLHSDPIINIVELNNDLISQASKLLVSYIYPSEWNDSLLNECKISLKNLLESNIAEFYLARLENELLGFVSINWGFSTTTGKRILRIQDLYTSPDYRKNGIANRLLNFCEELALSKGANSLRLETDIENTSARNLYEKMSFEWFPRKQVYMKFID